MSEDEDNEYEEYKDDNDQPFIVPETDEPMDARGRAININPSYDKIINSY